MIIEKCVFIQSLFKPFVISPKYEQLWREENEKESTKSSIKESQKSKNEKLNNEKEIIGKEFQRKKTNSFEKERIKEIERKRLLEIKNKLMTQNRKNIMSFLKEFEGLKHLENQEETKYYNFSPVNNEEIKCFFKKLKNNKKYYIIN